MTVKELLAKLEKHEAECFIKLNNIESILEERGERLSSLDAKIDGLYKAVITSAFTTITIVVAIGGAFAAFFAS